MLNPERAAELLHDPDVVALVATVGKVSRELGRREVLEDLEAAGRAAAATAARTVWRRPPHGELQQRRYGREKYVPAVEDAEHQALRRRRGIIGELRDWAVQDDTSGRAS